MPKDTASYSSILFRSPGSDITLLDIPRSLEEGQVRPWEVPSRRIISTAPVTQPFATPEPGTRRNSNGAHHAPATASPAMQVANLMTATTVKSALQELATLYNGPYCLPRIVSASDRDCGTEPGVGNNAPYIPTRAEYLHGSIEDTHIEFRDKCPVFDLIIVDPPWPNRSVRRHTSTYKSASDLAELDKMLSLIPVSSHLSRDGLVAIWVTNKSMIHEYITRPQGLLSTWRLELVTEWTWVKVTSTGEPIIDIDSQWRKPWEKLLICRQVGNKAHTGLNSRTILAVPDIHSRKPQLRALFQDLLPKGYKGLEIFARQLTAGWWSWGDDVLKFQDRNGWEETLEQ